MFWKKLKTLSSFKPHIFFIFSFFWMIKKVMDVSSGYLQNLFQVQIQQNDDKKT
jgi:hypothetical protein